MICSLFNMLTTFPHNTFIGSLCSQGLELHVIHIRGVEREREGGVNVGVVRGVSIEGP